MISNNCKPTFCEIAELLSTKKLLSLIFILIILSSTKKSVAQREANIWYFGVYAGLDFNSGIPIPLKDGKISHWEGVATFADSLGNLLFYTDGIRVWNRLHNVMKNGDGLKGDPSSTECAIVVPMPKNNKLYYIITVDNEAYEDGLCYSIVDMNLDNGNGDITDIKNIQLVTPVSEKITAIQHANNEDFWVIAHGYQTDSFFVYKITEQGLNPEPTIYQTGTRHINLGIWGTNAIGYMRASPDGHKIAAAINISQIIDVLNFNHETGEITNFVNIFDIAGSSYGVEFSADSKKLYSTSMFSLYQTDLSSNIPEEVIASRTKIATSDSRHYFGALQLATDGKIYMAHDSSAYLGVINKPGEKPEKCEFVQNGLFLEGRKSMIGLPNFIPAYFLPPDFKYSLTCFNDFTNFYFQSTIAADSVKWDFGDTQSGENNHSTEIEPSHLFSTEGDFFVQLFIYKEGNEYIKSQFVKINQLPKLELGEDTTICKHEKLLLTVDDPNNNVLWNNVINTPYFEITKPGKYFVQLTNKYTKCKNSDTIKINYAELPNFNLGEDDAICRGDSLRIGAYLPNAKFIWNTAQTDSFIFVKNQGIYKLQITDSLNCVNNDSINININELTIIDLGKDTIICPNTKIKLSLKPEEQPKIAKYLWSDKSNNKELLIDKPDKYWLQITDTNSCETTDTIVINEAFLPEVRLAKDTLICEDSIFVLTPIFKNVDFSKIIWNNNSADTFLIVSQKGFYHVKVKNICAEDADTIFVDTKYCGEVDIPNIITPNSDQLNNYFIIRGIENQQWHLEIYNRWGTKIYDNLNYDNTWDATGHADGVYFYIFTNHKKNIFYTGNISVYR